MPLLGRTIVGALILLAFAMPTVAAAQPGCAPVTSPSGNSEADQYAEGIPGPCANDQIQPGGQAGGAAVVPAATRKQLDAQGKDGQAAAQAAEGTAPVAPAAGTGSSAPGSGAGIGILLPLILAGTVLAGILYTLRRRRAGLAS
jgi:hypothetical protein